MKKSLVIFGVLLSAAAAFAAWDPTGVDTNTSGPDALAIFEGNFLQLSDVLNTNNPSALKLKGSALVAATVAVGAMGTGSVGSVQIIDGGVVSADLASGAATTSKIANAAVITAKIANRAVTGEKVGLAALSNEHYAVGSVLSNSIGGGSVGTTHFDTTFWNYIASLNEVEPETLVSNILTVGYANFTNRPGVKGVFMFGYDSGLDGEIYADGSGCMVGGKAGTGGRIVAGEGGFSHGVAVSGGIITSAPNASAWGYCSAGEIRANALGATAHGRISSAGTIAADGTGSTAAGNINSGGEISTGILGDGASARGLASHGGSIEATAWGATAQGRSAGTLIASSWGTFASGYVFVGGINATGIGSMAVGYVENGANIISLGKGAWAGGYVSGVTESNTAAGIGSFAFGRKVNANHNQSIVLGHGLNSALTNSVRVNTIDANNGFVKTVGSSGSNIVNKAYVDALSNTIVSAANAYTTAATNMIRYAVTFSPNTFNLTTNMTTNVTVRIVNAAGTVVSNKFGYTIWSANTGSDAQGSYDIINSFVSGTALHEFTAGKKYMAISTVNGELTLSTVQTSYASAFLKVIIDDRVYTSGAYNWYE